MNEVAFYLFGPAASSTEGGGSGVGLDRNLGGTTLVNGRPLHTTWAHKDFRGGTDRITLVDDGLI